MYKYNKQEKFFFNSVASAILLAICSVNTAVLAEENKVDEQKEDKYSKDNVIVVTASRRDESLQNVGLAITSIDPVDFTEAGLTSIENLIDYTAGVNFNTSGTPGSGTITMGGASQESATPVAGVYMDDVPLTSNVPFAGGSGLLFDGVLSNIERVEIIKGPQGTLYGATAVGGVVKYITKDPSLDVLHGEGSIDFSNTRHGGFNKIYRANISTPLVTDKLGISVSGYSNDTAGFVDRVVPALAKDVNDVQQSGYNVAVLWDISENASFKATALHSQVEWDTSPFISLEFPSQIPIFGRYQSDKPDSTNKLEYDLVSGVFKMDLDWSELTWVSAQTQYKSPTSRDQTDLFGGLADLFTGSAPGTNSVPTNAFLKSKKFVQELRFTSPKSDTVEWLAGLYYTKEDTNNNQDAIAQPTNFNLFDVSFPSHYKETALFGNVTWFIDPQFDVTLGARYSDNQLALDARFSGLFAAGGPNQEILFGDKVKDKVTSYSLGARWRPTDETSLYTRIANGYRPATVNLPLFDPATGANIAPPIINSDELVSYEFGVKGVSMEGKLHYDFALWAINWDNFQAAISFNGISVGGNAQAAIDAKGLEGELTFYATDNFKIRSNFAYTNSQLSADDATLSALKGEQSRNLPEWTASIKADYGFDISSFDGNAGLGVRYVGDYNTGYKSAVIGSGGRLNFPVDSYALVDFNVSLIDDNYKISFYITNIFDKYAFANADASDTFSGPLGNGVIVQPRTIGAVVSMSF